MMKRFCFFLILCIFCTSGWAETLYVPSLDYTTIQSAINEANTGDIIKVFPGIYKENINFSGKAITVTSMDANDPGVVAATIIDGNEPADSNFASVVTFNSGEDNNSVLTGFTIIGGSGSWILTSWEFKGLNWSRCGGGIACYNKSEPSLIKNVIKDNTAGQGAGIYTYGDPVNPNDPSNPAVHIKPVIKDNVFINNKATKNHGFEPPDTINPHFDRGDGGAIACFQGCDAVINDNIIQTNYADNYGGGIRLRQWSDPLITNNEIIDNNSLLGGGIHASYISSPTITENTISSNISRGLGAGGISLYYNSFGTITYNTILQNKAISSKAGGVGIFYNSSAIIENNIIAKNSALTGGGIYAVSGNTELKYNTIVQNTASTGSGICIESDANFTATGNIAALNTGSAQIYKAPQVTLYASYNDVWSENNDNFSGDINDFTGINGNISEEPKFTSADNNDFTQTVYSPCINSGDPNFVSEPGQLDINGDARLIGENIDIGADEAVPVWNISSQKQYITIQEAIDDSNDVDNIIAARGRYYETITFDAHQIVLSSTEPNDWAVVEKTIIDANQEGTAVVISGGQDANTIFRGFTVTNGNATNGHAGGIWCYASPRIERNIVINNFASYKGGGMYFYSSECSPLVTDNRIINNSADLGGGVHCDTASKVTLKNNLIADNDGSIAGGGICCGAYTGQSWIVNNTITGNSSWAGGGIASDNLAKFIKIIGNNLCGNSASGSNSRGGAISIMYGDPNIINNTIVNNRCPTGAGINIEAGGSPQIANNIVAFNELGAGIKCDFPPCDNVVSNNVYSNDGGNYGGSLADQTGINGNISIDAGFVDKGYWDDANSPADISDDIFVLGNYHLMPFSGCIDAGDNNSVPVLLQSDTDGEERIFNAVVDMGTDEVVTNPYDLNNDGIIDSYELNLLAAEWLQSGSELQTDFNENNFVDFLDYAELANEWKWQGGWYNGPIIRTQDPNDGSSFDSYENCIAHWRLNEDSGTIAREEIFLNNGTLFNFPDDNSQWVAGQLENGLKFEGTNDYVATNFSNLKTANDFTIVLWFKADEIPPSGSRTLFWQGEAGSNCWGPHQEMHLSLGGYPDGATYQPNTLTFCMTSQHLSLGKSLYITTDFSDTSFWHFVVIRVSNLGTSPIAEMDLDGEYAGSDTMDFSDLSRTNWSKGFRLGRPDSDMRYFYGKMDNVLVYNKRLTDDEIDELYNAAK